MRTMMEEREEFLRRSVARIAKLEEEIAGSRLTALEKERVLAARESEVRLANDSIRDIELRKSKWDEELNEIAGRRDQSAEMVRKLEEEALEEDRLQRQAEDDIETLNAQYNEEKRKLDVLSEEITAARIDVTSSETEMSGTDAIRKRIRESMDEITANIDMREETLEALEEERLRIYAENTSRYDADEKNSLRVALEEKIGEATRQRNEINGTLDDANSEYREIDDELTALLERKNAGEIKSAKLETQLESMKDRLWENFQMSYYQALNYRKEDFVMTGAVKENREIKARMAELGDVNIGAIDEYAKVSERYEFLTGQRADILSSLDDLNGIITDMDKVIKEKFKENFDKVAENFEEIFTELFGGGSAKLTLSDPDDPLEAEIDIEAQPPGKKLQNINLLSGGEKTMTAIAMMFAVLKTKPTPFCILDEVEASLDDSNIERFAEYLKKFDKTQFTLVTHQKATMEYADVLYGVTMPEQGVSKLLSLKLTDNFDFDQEN